MKIKGKKLIEILNNIGLSESDVDYILSYISKPQKPIKVKYTYIPSEDSEIHMLREANKRLEKDVEKWKDNYNDCEEDYNDCYRDWGILNHDWHELFNQNKQLVKAIANYEALDIDNIIAEKESLENRVVELGREKGKVFNYNELYRIKLVFDALVKIKETACECSIYQFANTNINGINLSDKEFNSIIEKLEKKIKLN
jgi:hypothetical protein